MIKPVKYFFEAFFVYLFFLIAKLIGLSLSRKFFSFIFKKIGPIIRSNNIIDKNLLKFSNELSNKEKKEIKANMWSNYGMTFIEYIFLNNFKKGQSHIDIEGENILRKISLDNKPVIFISGHFANFELMSMEITKKKINLATIYRPLNNFFLNPFMEHVRKKYVCKNQIKKGRRGVKESVEYIKNNHSIALMVDQRVSEGDEIKLFNHPAKTTTIPAQLVKKYGCRIVPVYIERIKNINFKLSFNKPIKFNDELSLEQITLELNKILEKMILKNPGLWIWSHDRWK